MARLSKLVVRISLSLESVSPFSFLVTMHDDIEFQRGISYCYLQ